MTAPFFNTYLRLHVVRISSAGVLTLGLFCHADSVVDVLVVTDSGQPVQPFAGVRVIELDLPTRIDAELTAGLPADPDQAAALVQQRLRHGGQELQRRLGRAYQGVAEAWGLGVAKLPAVVVDRRYVVYGEPDVARAMALIESSRRALP